jgi:hypothetical protein
LGFAAADAAVAEYAVTQSQIQSTNGRAANDSISSAIERFLRASRVQNLVRCVEFGQQEIKTRMEKTGMTIGETIQTAIVKTMRSVLQ